MKHWGARVGGALLFGFSVVFAFALIMQITTDFVHLVLGVRAEFLFRRGLFNMLTDMHEFWRVMTSLVFFSLILSTIFFIVKLRQRHGIFDIYDENGDVTLPQREPEEKNSS